MVKCLYETETDLMTEREIIDKFCLSHNWVARKNPCPAYQLDFSILRTGDELIGMAEVKRRHFKSAGYSGLMLSLHKWVELKKYSDLGLRTFIVVGFDDGVFEYQYVGAVLPAYFKGRRGRDPSDLEPCIFIPIADFKKVVII